MPPEEDPLARSKLVVVAFHYTHPLHTLEETIASGTFPCWISI